jgi:threonine synthase
VGVQAEPCGSLVEVWKAKKLSAPIEEREGGEIGFGEKVDFIHQAEYLALDAIYKSLGKAVAVSLDEVSRARRILAESEGFIASGAGASTLAAAFKLDAEGWIKRGERVLLYNPEGSLISAGPPVPGGTAKAVPPDAEILRL